MRWLIDGLLGFGGAEAIWTALAYRGLTVLDGGRRKLMGLAFAMGLALWVRRGRRLRVAALVAGVIAQGLSAGWRRRALSPLVFFEPGERPTCRVEEIEIALSTGSLPGVLFTPPRAEAVLLLIHGAGAHRASYTWPLIEQMLGAGYGVLTIDLDGHGTNQRVLDLPGVIENPVAAVGWLRQRFRWVGVIGISMGGCVAARAIADGLQVDGLVLLTSPIRVPYHARMRRREYLTLVQPATWAMHRTAGTWPLVQVWHSAPARCAISAIELIERLALDESISHIDCPVLLCYGGLDLIAPPEQARALLAAAPAGTELFVLPTVNHLVASLDPRLLRRIVAWLERVIRAEASVVRP